MEKDLLGIAKNFCTKGEPISVGEFGQGHINDTYLCTCDSGVTYILQRINHHVFTEPELLMENVGAISAYLNERISDPRHSLHFIPTHEGSPLAIIDENYWRMQEFITSSKYLSQTKSAQELYSAGLAFGNFQQQLVDYPLETLHEILHDFHNTKKRYDQFEEALKRDALARAKQCKSEIEFVHEHQDDCGQIVDRLESGELPIRITHNDTKLNNVLLDFDTLEPLCVIDLDNVMPGSALYDFGDSIRFGASTAAEDEKDLSKVNLDLDLFRSFTEGYLEGSGDILTPLEIEMLPVGCKVIMLECGMRFLTDFLNGDTYFKTNRINHNLDRARTQFKLVQSTEEQMPQLKRIVEEVSSQNS